MVSRLQRENALETIDPKELQSRKVLTIEDVQVLAGGVSRYAVYRLISAGVVRKPERVANPYGKGCIAIWRKGWLQNVNDGTCK